MKSANPARRSRLPNGYVTWLTSLKNRVRSAQLQAAVRVNQELLSLYWDIGHTIDRQQKKAGWGARIIPQLAADLHSSFPRLQGFSERNLKRMIAFYREYPRLFAIVPQAAAQLQSLQKVSARTTRSPVVARDAAIVPQPAAQLPWFHHVILMEKVKDRASRVWYMQAAVTHGWSRSILTLQIKSRAHARAGRAVHNFHETLPSPQSHLAEQVLKDPYVFDFLALKEPYHERELEVALLDQVQKFLLELGQGFAFVGRQWHLEVGEDDFYLDLLFYHLRLRCFVVVDLKCGSFKAEYAGKMNFYCNVVDDRLRHADDKPTVGLILCQDKNRIVAEYALQGVRKAIGVSQYAMTRALPKEFRSTLPTIEQMEQGLRQLARQKSRKICRPRKAV